tara:strand:- start:234 stop:356 length:123 start_codon:yes stop_codon:yes gene_type:complete
MGVVDLGQPPLDTKISGVAMNDIRKKGNPHSTSKYTYGKR